APAPRHALRRAPVRRVLCPRALSGVAPPGSFARPSDGGRLRSFWCAGSRRWFFSTDGAFFLPRLFAWVSRPWLRFLGNDPKNNAPHGGAARVRCFAHFLTI